MYIYTKVYIYIKYNLYKTESIFISKFSCMSARANSTFPYTVIRELAGKFQGEHVAAYWKEWDITHVPNHHHCS